MIYRDDDSCTIAQLYHHVQCLELIFTPAYNSYKQTEGVV